MTPYGELHDDPTIGNRNESAPLDIYSDTAAPFFVPVIAGNDPDPITGETYIELEAFEAAAWEASP